MSEDDLPTRERATPLRPEDERPTRRVGDLTQGRIDDLVSGWDSPVVPASPPSPPPAPRKKQTSAPPPVPPPRQKPPSVPPPVSETEPERPTFLDFEVGPTRLDPADSTDSSVGSSVGSSAGSSVPTVAKGAGSAPVDASDSRGDPTTLGTISDPGRSSRLALRPEITFPRRSGLWGDVRYVFTVAFGRKAARRDVNKAELKLASLGAERHQRILALGRCALAQDRQAQDGPEHPSITSARTAIERMETERNRRDEDVRNAILELEQVERQRQARAATVAAKLEAIDTEIASIAKQLEPLTREAQSVRRRAGELRDQLAQIDKRILLTEAKVVSMRGEHSERAQLQAEIASLRADRVAVARDEPELARQFDRIAPLIWELETAQSGAKRRRDVLCEEDKDDRSRVEEFVAAIGARRKVLDRAVADVDKMKDKAHARLGEKMCLDRVPLGRPLTLVEEIDLNIGDVERQLMELRELTATIDHRARRRGIAVLIMVGLATAGGVGFALLSFVGGT